MIILSNQKLVAKGGEKLVFIHPNNPSQLIKVINPDYIDFMQKNRGFSYKVRRLKHYWFFANMIGEHIASREQAVSDSHYLQNITGLVDTDMGLGIIVEGIYQQDGSLGLTLGDLIKQNKYCETHQQSLENFVAWMQKTHIIIRDLWLDNLVWNEKQQHFVLIDGIGGRYLPTLRAYCRWYNLRGNKKRGVKLLQRVKRFQSNHSL